MNKWKIAAIIFLMCFLISFIGNTFFNSMSECSHVKNELECSKLCNDGYHDGYEYKDPLCSCTIDGAFEFGKVF